MRRLIALCVVLVLPGLAAANWGLFHRPAPPPTQSYYYAPLPIENYYYYPIVPAPVPVYPVPVEETPSFPVAPTNPAPAPLRPRLVPSMPLAPPEVAPPSTAPLFQPSAAMPMPYADERSTSARPLTAFFDIYTNGAAPVATIPGRFVNRFWNLSPDTLTLKVDGQNLEVPRGQSRMVETAGEFSWQVAGRALEISRVPPDARGVTVTIRR